MLKRYLLFTFTAYEGNGGWENFEGSFDTIEEAKKQGDTDTDSSNAHVVDIQTGKIISEGYRAKLADLTFTWSQTIP